MRKFSQVLKDKQGKAEQLFEQNILSQFKRVYNALLEKYEVSQYKELSEKYQEVFLAELNSYWTEEDGLSESGSRFINLKQSTLNESSTNEQKKIRLMDKSKIIINETLRQSNLKWKLYGVIDEMYNEVNASHLSDVLPASELIGAIKESFISSLKEILTEVNYELKESTK